MKNGGFKIRPVTVKEHGVTYRTFQLVGYLAGQRVRKRFKSREEALGEKNRMDVLAANTGEIRSVNTRLSREQLADAEASFQRLGGKSLSVAVDWYLATYRPPSVPKALGEAVAAYLAAKAPNVEPVHLVDVKAKLKWLVQWFPDAVVEDAQRAKIEERMRARGWGPKTWNNVRGCFHSFFDYCADDDRRWVAVNPMARIEVRKVARGLPVVETANRIRALFEFLESHTGGPRRKHPPGFLVPYFALATFAGLRPSVPDGEIWKIGQLADASRVVDTTVGVIRLSPEIAKTDSVRQIKIRPNLAAWLARYPLKKYPIVMPNLAALVTAVRVKFGLTDDVLRHTWISMHVAAFKSLGEAALEAGNSETIVRRHYLNLVSEIDAMEFWAILPRRLAPS